MTSVYYEIEDVSSGFKVKTVQRESAEVIFNENVKAGREVVFRRLNEDGSEDVIGAYTPDFKGGKG